MTEVPDHLKTLLGIDSVPDEAPEETGGEEPEPQQTAPSGEAPGPEQETEDPYADWTVDDYRARLGELETHQKGMNKEMSRVRQEHRTAVQQGEALAARFSEVLERIGQQMPQPNPEEVDPLDELKADTARQIQPLAAGIQDLQYALSQQQMTAVASHVVEQVQAYRAEHPEFEPARMHVRKAFGAWFASQGMAPDDIEQAVDSMSTQFAIQQVAAGRNPAEAVMELATNLGWQNGSAQPAVVQPNGADRATRVRKGLKAGHNARPGGGAAGQPAGMRKFLSMTRREQLQAAADPNFMDEIFGAE